MSPTVLPVLIVAGLIAGLAVFIAFRRPPAQLWPPLLAYQVCGVALVAGYLLSEFAAPPWGFPVGACLIYAGALLGASLCWPIALRYAEAQHWPFPWARNAAVWGPVAAGAAVAALAAFAVVRGELPLPLEIDHAARPWTFLVGVAFASAVCWGAVALYAGLALRTSDAAVRRSAALVGGALAAVLLAGMLALLVVESGTLEPSIYAFAATDVILLVAAYRTRVISVLSMALRRTLDHDPDAVVLVDGRGLWLHSNPAAAELLGPELAAPRSDVLARIARDLRDATGQSVDREDLARRVRASAASGDVVGPLCIDGGRFFRLSATEIPVGGAGAAPLSLRLHDVTASQQAAAALRDHRDALERRIAERTRELEVAVTRLEEEVATRRRAEVELRQSERRHRQIAEVSTDLSFAFHVDAEGQIRWRWVTRSVDSLTGYTSEELGNLGWQSVVHPDDLDDVFGQRDRLMQGEPLDFEFRILTKAGETRWLEISVRATRDPARRVLRAVGAVRDITERKRSSEERRLLERRNQETQRLESLGVLAGGIAHDFNNLLAVIAGNATLATAEIAAPDALQKRLDRIRAAADYAVALTDQILTYAGKPALVVETVDLGDLVMSMLDLLRASTTPKVRIETQLCDELPAVEGDPTQIRQILMNLISNAAESLEDRDGRILLRTGWIQAGQSYLNGAYGTPNPEPGDYVYVEVVDNGRGIDEESRRRIFEPFFSTKFSGRGLGLAAVHGIVQAHGGVIKLTTETGWGTAFRVLFPRCEGTVDAAVAATTGRAVAETTARTHATPARDATVLVVDDDEAVLEIAQEFLARAGFHVLTAGGGVEAVQCIEEHGAAVDAVVLDLSMPGVDGEQTLREIRRRRPGIPVLLVSGYSEEMAAASFGGTEGADAFLAKPYVPETLIERVREILGD